MDLEAVNLSRICRTCKCNSLNMRSLFEKCENQNHYINEMLMACATVHVICGDGLPSQICEECMERLINAYIFKNQCEKVDLSLRRYAENLSQSSNVKEELEDSHFIEINTNDLLDEQEPESKENILDSTTTLVKWETTTDNIQSVSNEQVLTCKKCHVVFSTLEDQNSHKCNHSRIYRCKECDREFTTPRCLLQHERRHRRKKAYVCKICDKTLVKAEGLRRHLITHTSGRERRPFSCKSCNRSFTRNEHLRDHVPKCKGDTVFRCNICKKFFNREHTLEFHKRIHNTEQTTLAISINPENILDHYYQIELEEKNTPWSTAISYSCDSSEETMGYVDKIEIKEDVNISNFDYKSNSRKSTVPVLNNEDGNNADEGINESLESEGIEGNKEVKKEEEMDSFLIGVNQDSSVGAKINAEGGNDDLGDSTESKYLSKKNLSPKEGDGHKQYNLSGDVCEKSFNNPNSLVNHEADEHGIEEKVFKIHQCKECNKTFPSKPRLKQHLKIHKENFKKYLCSECGQGYSCHNHLVIHMLGHSGEKPYKCKYCGKGFLRTSHVVVHERSHTGEITHLCTVCGKGFGSASNYAVHMRTHTGEKPYQCNYCEAAFTVRTNLKDHIQRKHTGEKVQCDLCTESVSNDHMLVQHKKTAHDDPNLESEELQNPTNIILPPTSLRNIFY